MARQVDRWLERLGGLVLPPRCVLCGARGQPACLDLCMECELALPAAHPAIVPGPPPLRAHFAAFAYDHPVDHLVHALKYRGQLAVGRVLGTLLAGRAAAAGLARWVDLVVPVPLHPARHAERTFNQSAEIARWVARLLPCDCDMSVVTRARATLPQVGLSREHRSRNLAGAFHAAAAVRGQRVVVVDDVITTGSTVRAVGEALLAAGAASVSAWCACRAEAPEALDLRESREDRRT